MSFADNGITKLELGNEEVKLELRGHCHSQARAWERGRFGVLNNDEYSKPPRCPSFPSSGLGTHLSSKLRFGSMDAGMRSRYRVHHPDRAHFVTCTIVEWLPVFTSSVCCDIVVNSLQHCRVHKSLKIYAWLILENHVHAVLAAPDLSAVLRDLKSFTAAKILEQLAREDREWLLNQLHYYRSAHKPNTYQVWQEGSHPQVIMDDATMLQKLEYLHNNPVKRGWVTAPEHWCYSSAHEWLPGTIPLLRCDEWR